ncbi:NAD(P)-dependent alcohol dehydrogenase [Streptomyces antarcticus]|uniref:NAD(P)-dependent alcohol dehydrogenase n=1 Tax=Streptomyces antarcticus TaxID=2996458 RepID=UPI00226E4E7A|nr:MULTISPECIES: NAD(P)-dependent alcohol dehydrogenase [unclassified Streptomyces]MCY0939790.1 NAD(P)-dependent alcohol dehydrogenase [Streptomyces sp. H34-AA3]MCZ4080960.1 NAD(P)-dependent alcohol dehydrogenase [Streptomyces sp. H34-S5]
MPTSVTAAVSRVADGEFRIEVLELDDPRPDEVLVRYTAVGLCHTDLEAAAGRLPTPLPVVLGHEGAGTVEAVGSAVTGFAPGDRVVLSLDSCGACRSCLAGQPAYCEQHIPLNFASSRTDGSVGLRDAAGKGVHDHFFGQSSFASHGLAHPRGLVKVPDDLPLTTLAPLGCGIITGAGAVLNSLAVRAGSTVAVFGLGAVGLAAVMAAAASGATRIIAVDRVPGRLGLAGELGATDVVDASTDTAQAVMELTGGRGVDHSVESTGAVPVMNTAISVLAPLGSAAVLGVAGLDAELKANAFELLKGRSVTGSVMGHQAPGVLIPRLLDLHHQNRFPLDRLVTTYPLADINRAVADVRAGRTVKAVLTHDA